MVANDSFVDWTYDTGLANAWSTSSRLKCLLLKRGYSAANPAVASIDSLKGMRTEALLAISTLRAVERKGRSSASPALLAAA
jgi:hypothetical protein